jgi:hypothetical protein
MALKNRCTRGYNMVQRMMNYIILKSQILVCDLSTMQNSVNYINTFPSNGVKINPKK